MKKYYIITILLVVCLISIIKIRSPSFIENNLYVLDYFQYKDSLVPTKFQKVYKKKIGIIDGPINSNHKELQHVKISQKEFVSNTTDADMIHATAVAGLICAEDNNIGISGAVNISEIVNAVVLSNSSVKQDSLAHAIKYCVDENVNVINISIEIYQFSEELIKAIKYAEKENIKIFMSNGNGGWRKKVKKIDKPKFSNVLFVGMNSRSGEESLTNMAYRNPDIYEIGDNLISLGKEGFDTYSGTSFSCAIASSKYLLNQ